MNLHTHSIIFLFFLLTVLTFRLTGQSDVIFEKPVSIDENGSPPDPTALLDLTAGNKGLLIPRVNLNDS